MPPAVSWFEAARSHTPRVRTCEPPRPGRQVRDPTRRKRIHAGSNEEADLADAATRTPVFILALCPVPAPTPGSHFRVVLGRLGSLPSALHSTFTAFVLAACHVLVRSISQRLQREMQLGVLIWCHLLLVETIAVS